MNENYEKYRIDPKDIPSFDHDRHFLPREDEGAETAKKKNKDDDYKG